VSKFWIILQREYAQIVKKKSFIVGIILTPVFMIGIMVVPALLATKQSSETQQLAVVDQSGMGYGEQFKAGMARYTLPDSTSPAYEVTDLLVVEPSDSARRRAVDDSLKTEVNDNNVKFVLGIGPQALVADTNLVLLTNSDDWQAVSHFESVLSDVLASERLRQSGVNLAVDSVLQLTRGIDLPIRNTKGDSIPFMTKYFAALIFVFLVYIMIIGFGATLMRSVIEEKNSRIMEVLVSSVSPFQLMLGKVLGLALAAFTQVGVWVVMGAALSAFSGAAGIDIDPAVARIAFNPVIVIFFVAFFVVGYIMYSTIFALIGSIVNSDKESQNFMFPIVIFLMIPVIVGASVARDPFALPWVVISHIPFCAPTMMLQRIVFVAPAATEYSFFSGILMEATISLIVVTLTTLGMIWLTGKIFRVGILMYGKRPTLPEIIRWVRY
jgi:ABC-2 type transport system permease protein